MQKLSGEGDTPSPDPTHSAPTALKLNVTPPEKNSRYGLVRRRHLYYSDTIIHIS